MKKFFSILIMLPILFFSSLALADDVDLPSSGDLWDNWNSSQDNYREGQNVTDEQFNKVVDQLKEKKNKKLRKKQVPKGEEFHQGNESEGIKEEVSEDSLPVISVPIELCIGEEFLPVGHYQIKAEKNENGNTVINFYQAHYIMAQVPAIETNDDFGEEEITFAKWVDQDDNHIKVIFGSMDINAYTIIKIKE